MQTTLTKARYGYKCGGVHPDGKPCGFTLINLSGEELLEITHPTLDDYVCPRCRYPNPDYESWVSDTGWHTIG